MTDRLEISGIHPLVGDPSDLLGALAIATPHSDHIARMVKRRGEVMEMLAGGPEFPMSAALEQMRQAGVLVVGFKALILIVLRSHHSHGLLIRTLVCGTLPPMRLDSQLPVLIGQR